MPQSHVRYLISLAWKLSPATNARISAKKLIKLLRLVTRTYETFSDSVKSNDKSSNVTFAVGCLTSSTLPIILLRRSTNQFSVFF